MIVEGGRDLVGGVWRGCGEVGGHQRSRSSHTPSHSLPTTDTSHQYGATGCSQAASAGHRHQAEIRDTIKILETTIRDQSSLQIQETPCRDKWHRPEIRDIIQRSEISFIDQRHRPETRYILYRQETSSGDQRNHAGIRNILQWSEASSKDQRHNPETRYIIQRSKTSSRNQRHHQDAEMREILQR